MRNKYLDFLIDVSFQGVNILFLLSFNDEDCRERYNKYNLSTVEIKYFNVMIYGRTIFDETIKNNLRTYDNIQKL